MEELKAIYNNIMPKPLKTHVSRDYLRPRISYRLQELAFGGLKEEIKDKLLEASEASNGYQTHKKNSLKKLLPGTKICKKWEKLLKKSKF